jgi:hypothetical protein
LTSFEREDRPFAETLGFTQMRVGKQFLKEIRPYSLVRKKDTLKFLNADNMEDSIDMSENLRKGVFRLTLKQYKPTDENPLVTIITKKVRFTNECGAYVRFFTVGEFIVITLISGVFFFEDNDGNMLKLKRAVSTKQLKEYPEEAFVDYTAEDFRKKGSYIEKETNLPFDSFAIIDAIFTLDTASASKEYVREDVQGEKYSLSCHLSPDNFIYYNPESLNKYLAARYKRMNSLKKRQKKAEDTELMNAQQLKELDEKFPPEKLAELFADVDDDDDDDGQPVIRSEYDMYEHDEAFAEIYDDEEVQVNTTEFDEEDDADEFYTFMDIDPDDAE